MGVRVWGLIDHFLRGWRLMKKKQKRRLGFTRLWPPDELVVHLQLCSGFRKVDVRLPGKGNSNSHAARPVHPIITMKVDSDQ